MARRRAKDAKPYRIVLSTRANPEQVADVIAEARKRKISKSMEVLRRLEFYSEHAKQSSAA